MGRGSGVEANNRVPFLWTLCVAMGAVFSGVEGVEAFEQC